MNTFNNKLASAAMSAGMGLSANGAPLLDVAQTSQRSQASYGGPVTGHACHAVPKQDEFTSKVAFSSLVLVLAAAGLLYFSSAEIAELPAISATLNHTSSDVITVISDGGDKYAKPATSQLKFGGHANACSDDLCSARTFGKLIDKSNGTMDW